MNRRDFLAATGGLIYLSRSMAATTGGLQADLVIAGGGIGGFAAALAALENGLRVVLLEESEWIGGQLTQQGVPPDEHPWIEAFGATRRYQRYRQSVREHYRKWYPIERSTADQRYFNPGRCSVSKICHEPRVALAVLRARLGPFEASGQLRTLLRHESTSAEVSSGRQVRAIEVRNLETGDTFELTAPYFVDATELGDLLPMTGTEFVTGAEARSDTGEPHAPEEAAPANMQAATWCFAVEYREGEDHRIDPPPNYDFWKNYVPNLTPAWPGRLLSLTYAHPITLEPITRSFDPRPGSEDPGLWAYRRLVDPSQFEGRFRKGVTLVNWPQNDYLEGNLFGESDEARERHLRGARELSLSLLYWLQTEAPRPDGGLGWRGLRPRGDLMGTSDGLAKRPYIRESRRIRSRFTVLEQHVATEARVEITGLPEGEVSAETFPDSVGIGSYRIDLHPSTGGDNYIDISSLPFEIPLGALLPLETINLLPACKNVGTTHVTNGCYRLHPVEWGIGEAVGSLVPFCLEHGVRPHEVREDDKLLEQFQGMLTRQGAPFRWPDPRRAPR